MSDLLDEAHEFLLCMDKMEYADALFSLRAELTEERRQLAAQPAVPEAVAKVSAEEIIQKIIDYGYEKERGASCVYRYEAKQYDEEAASILNELRAILSATDSEGRSNG